MSLNKEFALTFAKNSVVQIIQYSMCVNAYTIMVIETILIQIVKTERMQLCLKNTYALACTITQVGV